MASMDLGDFSVRYYGPALDDDHSISARALAPALLELSDAVEAAKSTLEPNAKVDLRVEATRPGSFDIHLILQGVFDFSTTPEGRALAYLSDVGGVGMLAVILGAIKYVKLRLVHGPAEEISSKPAEEDPALTFSEDEVTVRHEDGTVATYHRSTLKIAQNEKFVNSLGKALAGPANTDGIDGAEVSGNQEVIDIPKEQARELKEWTSEPDEEEEKPIENDSRVLIQPLDLHLESGKKWNVTTGGGTKYQVDVEDDDFLDRLKNGERLGRKDTFDVTMHTVSTVAKNGQLTAKYTITKVHRHNAFVPDKQGTLF